MNAPTIISLQQGTEDWHAHRRCHYNASEASAMLGLSSYKTRASLLAEKATGITKEIDAATQRRFDLGHEYEATARPWAEEIIGDDLYPVVISQEINGLPLSASLDGINLMNDTAWEHKTLNSKLAASLDAGIIPDEYHPQMEQALMLSGAERCLFMASSGDKDGMRFAWYTSRPELRAQLLQNWKQFAADLDNYQHAEAKPEAIGHAPDQLPALHIEVTGMVTASNLAAFNQTALTVFRGINTELHTDQDFADAEQAVKFCKDAEDRLEAAKSHALSQTASIDDLFRTIDAIKDEARTVRLKLDKLVKSRKESVRYEIMSEYQAKLTEHIGKLNARLGDSYLSIAAADFATAIKGKKTLQGCRDACDTELARAKINASEVADRIFDNLNAYSGIAAGHEFLFADLGQIIAQPKDAFVAMVEKRINDYAKAELAKAEAKHLEDERAHAKQAGSKPDPVREREVVIEHQDEISQFLASRSFKDESRIRAILVEFVKFQAKKGQK